MVSAGRLVCALAAAAALAAGCGGRPAARTWPDSKRGKATYITTGCGTCHALAAAGTKGTVGPGLDDLRLTRARVTRFVRDGGPDMPAYVKTLSPSEIADVAAFVSAASGG